MLTDSGALACWTPFFWENVLSSPPIIGFCGASNSGKTTLVARVIAQLTAQGMKVAAVKHHGHPTGLVSPVEPKDTDRLQAAGAQKVVLLHPQGVWLMAGPDLVGQDPLAAAGEFLQGHDLVILEGFKEAEAPKIEVVAPGREPILPPGGRILALAMRGGGEHASLPVLDADDPRAVTAFVIQSLDLKV
jgi:molybdopterin-guanine dinucleotide biosynthesis protein MobB